MTTETKTDAEVLGELLAGVRLDEHHDPLGKQKVEALERTIARLRGEGAPPEQQGQAVAFDFERARTLIDYVVGYARAAELKSLSSDACVVLRDLHTMLHAPQPTQQGGGDAVRALVAKWRSESTSDDQSSDYECGEHSARSECADELEAALAQDCASQDATPPELMTEGDKTAAQSRMIDELTAPGCGACADGCKGRGSCRVRDESPPSAPVGGGPDWRYAAVSAIEYIDAGDHDEARDILRSALDLSDEASAPSAPVEVEGLLADLETIWHSVSDDKETNAAYQRLKSALTQQPAAVDEEGVDRAVQAWFESSASDDRASMREAISAYLSIQPGGSNNDR